jgi:DNA phosphorothioation-dependent restriction protein DptG
MNKNRRKELMEWVRKAEEWAAQGETLKDELENICSDEEMAFDSMPEGLQAGQNGMNSEEAIDAMNEAMECMDNAIEAAGEATSCVEDII